MPADRSQIIIAACRLLAAELALGSAVPLWFGGTAGAAAQQPDPDTWAEVAGGLAFAAGTLSASAALVYVAVALGRFAWSGARLDPRRRRRLGLAASYIAIWLLMLLDLG